MTTSQSIKLGMNFNYVLGKGAKKVLQLSVNGGCSIVYEKPLTLKYDIDLFINNHLLRHLDLDSCYLKKRERRRYSVNLKDTD